MAAHTEIMKPRKGLLSKLLTASAALFLLVVIYVLSAGPVVNILRVPGVMPTPFVEKFYAPLIWVCDHNESASRAMSRYIHHSWPN